MTGTAELVYDEKDITDVYIDTSLEIRFEHHIAAHRLPVAVESQTDQFSACIHDRASRVTSGDVVVAEETCHHLALFICILTVILVLPKLLKLLWHNEFPIIRIFLFHDSVKSSIMLVHHCILRGISSDGTISISHCEVCVRIRRLTFLPFEKTRSVDLSCPFKVALCMYGSYICSKSLCIDRFSELACRIVEYLCSILRYRLFKLFGRCECTGLEEIVHICIDIHCREILRKIFQIVFWLCILSIEFHQCLCDLPVSAGRVVAICCRNGFECIVEGCERIFSGKDSTAVSAAEVQCE